MVWKEEVKKAYEKDWPRFISYRCTITVSEVNLLFLTEKPVKLLYNKHASP
jgi:hypothetical protein